MHERQEADPGNFEATRETLRDELMQAADGVRRAQVSEAEAVRGVRVVDCELQGAKAHTTANRKYI